MTPVLRAPAVSAAQAVSSFRDCSDCPEMVSIPAGSFMMGSPEGESGRDKDEGPQRRVTVRAFAAGKYEVTWAEWDRCVAAGGCPMLPESVTKNRNPTTRPGLFYTTEPVVGEGTDAAHPVRFVTREEAQAFVKWISKKTGHTYRLLSEAEWEYAARAGTTTAFSFGDDLWALDANGGLYERQTYRPSTPVGSFPANAFGLHDMHGNASELVEDCYEPDYAQGQPSDGSAHVPESSRAYGLDCYVSGSVARGGSWSDFRNMRSAGRDRIEHRGLDDEDRESARGFRVARSRDLAASAPSASSLEAGTTPATTPAPERTSPEWARRPSAEDMGRYFPERAQRMEVSGKATIECLVLATGDLSDCSIVSESPPDMGFGDATLRASRLFKMKPATLLGQPVDGGKVRIPVTWNLP